MTKPPSSRTNLASCVLATIFLIFIIIILLVLYFTLFKPQDPEIAVHSVRLPSFSSSNGTVTFTFSQSASVRNPNRYQFSHFDSSLQVFYSGYPVGFMFIPADSIDAGRTEHMVATFTVHPFPLSPPPQQMVVVDPNGGVGRVGPMVAMEMESRLAMAGRVRVLHLFTHRVAVKADCRLAVSVTDGSVLGFRC
ncbi:hypothetical protein RIF29_37514 [Crotalaria pallida]|uniref:Late embryogenesis abundant protein LEA-2 subgroup domain-containing protein n=1 Tax=Crotalaria pallida TaxID=3830 RepID=A0AAN9HWC8_CROPI